MGEINFYMMTNAESDVTNSTCRCIEGARWALASKGITFIWDIAAGFGQNKSKCVSVGKFFLQTPIPYLISVDRDVVFTAEQLERLYRHLEAGYDLISGIYCMRSGKKLSGYIGEDKHYYLDGQIVEFQYIPLGFTGISRKLLQKMVDELELPQLGYSLKFYPFFEQHASEEMNEICGDDTSFCEKAHKVGVKAYVDTSLQVGHYGEHLFTIQDYVNYQEMEKRRNEVSLRESS